MPSDKKTKVRAKPRLRLLSRREMLERVPLSYPTVWKKMIDGDFPRSREIGGKCAWLESEIDDWISNRPLVRLKGDVAVSKQQRKRRRS
jgi:predicted DNA-binding transcriptional regulator AlpA